MTLMPSGWSLMSRSAAAVGIVAVVAAVPLMVRRAASPEAASGALMMPLDDGVAISSPLHLSDRLPLTIESGSIIRTAGERGTTAGVVIDAAVLTLDLSDRETRLQTVLPAPDFKDGTLPRIAGFTSDTLRLTRAYVRVIGPHGGAVRLDDVNATITTTRKGSYKVVATGRLNDQPVALDAVWSEAPADRAAPIPLKMTLRSPVLELALDGQVKDDANPQFVGQADVQLPHLKRFAKWAGLGRGVGPQLHSVSVSGPAEWTGDALAFAKASIAVNGNHATGALTIKHAGNRLLLDGTLGFQELDFGRSWPSFAPGKPTGSQEPHILTVIDADLRLSATKIYGPAFEMGRAAVSIALNKGRLQADMAELEIESGTAGAQLSIDLNQSSPKALIKARLRGVDAGRVLAAPLRRNALLGRANVSFEGTLGGPSIGETLATMEGKGSFDLVEPGRIGIDIQALVHAARNAATVDWTAAGKGTTAVDTLTARFRLLNGALTIESIQARSGTAMMVGSGRLDVPGRLMDVSIATGPSASPGEAPMTAQDILALRGTWDAPAISLLPPAPPPQQQPGTRSPPRVH
jgi:AsmA protein